MPEVLQPGDAEEKMTVGELKAFLTSFIDECEVISIRGDSLTFKYMLGDEGEGFVVAKEEDTT